MLSTKRSKTNAYSRGDPLRFLDVDVNFIASCLRHRARLWSEETSPANRKHATQTNGLASQFFRRRGIALEKALLGKGRRVSVAKSFANCCSLSYNSARITSATLTAYILSRTLPKSLYLNWQRAASAAFVIFQFFETVVSRIDISSSERYKRLSMSLSSELDIFKSNTWGLDVYVS